MTMRVKKRKGGFLASVCTIDIDKQLAGIEIYASKP